MLASILRPKHLPNAVNGIKFGQNIVRNASHLSSNTLKLASVKSLQQKHDDKPGWFFDPVSSSSTPSQLLSTPSNSWKPIETSFKPLTISSKSSRDDDKKNPSTPGKENPPPSPPGVNDKPTPPSNPTILNRKKDKKKDDDNTPSNDNTTNRSPSSESTGPTSAAPPPPPSAPASPPSDDPPSSSKGRKSSSSNSDRNPNDKLYDPATTSNKSQILLLPITRRPLIPGFHKAIQVYDKEVVSALRKMYQNEIDDRCIGVFLLKDEHADTDTISSVDEVYPVGVYARIGGFFPNEGGNGGCTVIMYPIQRIKLEGLVTPTVKTDAESEEAVETAGTESSISEDAEVTSFEKESNHKAKAIADLYKSNVSWIKASDLDELPYDTQSDMIHSLTSEMLRTFRDMSMSNKPFKDQVANFAVLGSKFKTTNIYDEPGILADLAASLSAGSPSEIQEVLASLDIEDRLKKTLVLLRRELMNLQLQEKINQEVDSKIQKRQREFILMEQMKGIKRELGIDDGKEKLVDTFKDRANSLDMPEAVKTVFDDEIAKLMTLEPTAAEYNVTRMYLDWITQLPWGKYTTERYDIPEAMKVLEEDHYGLKDVKDRILEFIAVGKLLGTVDGKILCFVGPPGVGKTSVAKSIAKALDREFYRFSIGGVSDVSELKGHRRTYVGALPGRIVQALKKCQSMNPLILIDEIDKIGRAGFHGDPSAVLLELLDPEQNNTFLDHYMDIPIDMSKTLFVCTANVLDTIPAPLLDRMEVIDISGYVAQEKVAIAENYLAPQAKKVTGLETAHVSLTKDAIEALISHYCRESGVRNLKKHIEKIFRKAAFKIVRDIDDQALKDAPKVVEGAVEITSNIKAEDETVAQSEPLATNDEPVVEPEAEKKEEPIHFPPNTTLSDVINEPVRTEEKPAETVEESSSEEAKNEDTKAAPSTPAYQPLKIPDSVNVVIVAASLKDYIGPPVYTADRMYEVTPAGVVMGLAWTQLGGAALYVESVLEQPITNESRPGLNRTGQLGDVMKESSIIAYSFTRMFLGKKFPENRFFEKARIHLHCPEGAVPKDGPSAGITMATSLLSLALDEPLNPAVAMTGEMTLTGKVLRIGGLREKAVAAKRSGADTILFPKDNVADWDNLPENVKEGLQGVPVSWYQDVFDKVFPNLDPEKAKSVWKEQFDKIDEQHHKSRRHEE